MNESQTTALSLRAAYAYGAANGLKSEVDDIREMVIEWDRPISSSLRRGYIVELFRQRGVFDDFKDKHWAFGKTAAGESKTKRYLRIKQQYEDFLHGKPEEAEDEENGQQFAAESDLRDFLAENLTRIEPGLKLYRTGERSGVEFPVEGGYVDILAVDRDNNFVVIELKVGRGRNKAVGQLLYYMGWVDQHLSKTPCRGIIVAKEIPEDLLLTVKRVPGIQLYQYSLSVTVKQVTS